MHVRGIGAPRSLCQGPIPTNAVFLLGVKRGSRIGVCRTLELSGTVEERTGMSGACPANPYSAAPLARLTKDLKPSRINPLLHVDFSDYTEAGEVVAVSVLQVEPRRQANFFRPREPGAAPGYPRIADAPAPGAAVGGCVQVGKVHAVERPFGDIANRVVNTEGIRLEGADRQGFDRGRVAALRVFPFETGLGAGDVAVFTDSRRISPDPVAFLAGPGQVFPLAFAGQAVRLAGLSPQPQDEFLCVVP